MVLNAFWLSLELRIESRGFEVWVTLNATIGVLPVPWIGRVTKPAISMPNASSWRLDHHHRRRRHQNCQRHRKHPAPSVAADTSSAATTPLPPPPANRGYVHQHDFDSHQHYPTRNNVHHHHHHHHHHHLLLLRHDHSILIIVLSLLRLTVFVDDSVLVFINIISSSIIVVLGFFSIIMLISHYSVQLPCLPSTSIVTSVIVTTIDHWQQHAAGFGG